MSRVSKIPSRHQTYKPARIHTVYAEPRIPAGLTSPEQADAHQAAYRTECDTRRQGARIETLDDNGEWTLKQSYKFIKMAKRAATSQRYAV